MAGDIGCVVLAAGSSARLGQPKALIKVGDGNLIGWLVSRLRAKGLDPLVVTNEDIIEEVTNSVDCRVIVNPEPEAGRTGTLQVGISHLESDIRQRVLVVPVDRPGFSDSTLEALISSAATSCPTEGGKGGHPILLSAEDVARVIQSPPSTSLRDLIDPHRIEVSDSHLHLNVDRQEDLGWLTDAFSGL
jgi:molybdenum cofactor cytidylyltransferase|tara:strand:+ start:295 stop:861 length:567 start_codon:yes stop_codon:yes gene_type:complete